MPTESRDHILIFDTTLRDGEQSPGCSMTLPEKLRIARMLEELGVDIIEAGFPIASEGDFESVRAVAAQTERARVCALARAADDDIDRAWEAIRHAARPRLHVFLATSALHREHKLRLSRPEILERTRTAVALARTVCDDVEFSPEDASRTEPEFLAEVVASAVEAGATTINLPDTVGYATPAEYRSLFASFRAALPAAITLSAHCHDDLGLAVANSLAAVEGGARQIECTINGIGERAGNAALEEVVMALRTRRDRFGVQTSINTPRLAPTSRAVATITRSPVARTKAIVGENAFAHEAGIHQHGVLACAATYEIMNPRDVGVDRGTLVLGKHSGRHAVRDRARQLGYTLTEPELDAVTAAVKRLADRKKSVFDEDLEAILLSQDPLASGPWRMESLRVTSGGADATATVRLVHIETERTVTEAAAGDGPVHAAFRALTRAASLQLRLVGFQVRSVSTGEDAQGEAIIDVRHDGIVFRGRGLSTDIVEAAALATLDIINRVQRRADNLSLVRRAPRAIDADRPTITLRD
ncbi:MAG: 2-isopropylmalate synthase [Phycisphaerales bacterium]|nr:2-isopropylmalate synthase [Phycisphaerales bacterium]